MAMVARQSRLAARPAIEADALEALFPEADTCRLNRDHVFVVPDEDGRLLGGAVLYHGGHELAIVGAVRFVDGDRRPAAFRALVREIQAWCGRHGVRKVMHLAGTPECAAIVRELGGESVATVEMLRLVSRRREVAPDTCVALRFVSPFDGDAMRQYRNLIDATGGHHEMSPACPVWEYVSTTLGAWQEDRLVGYLQFGLGFCLTWLWGTRVAPAVRGQGIGRRLIAGWLQVSALANATMAFGYVAPGNLAMEAMLTMARFKAQPEGLPGMRPDDPGLLYSGGDETFAWARGEVSESWR